MQQLKTLARIPRPLGRGGCHCEEHINPTQPRMINAPEIFTDDDQNTHPCVVWVRHQEQVKKEQDEKYRESLYNALKNNKIKKEGGRAQFYKPESFNIYEKMKNSLRIRPFLKLGVIILLFLFVFTIFLYSENIKNKDNIKTIKEFAETLIQKTSSKLKSFKSTELDKSLLETTKDKIIVKIKEKLETCEDKAKKLIPDRIKLESYDDKNWRIAYQNWPDGTDAVYQHIVTYQEGSRKGENINNYHPRTISSYDFDKSPLKYRSNMFVNEEGTVLGRNEFNLHIYSLKPIKSTRKHSKSISVAGEEEMFFELVEYKISDCRWIE